MNIIISPEASSKTIVIHEILSRLSLGDLVSFSITSKGNRELYLTDDVWFAKSKHDFNVITKPKTLSWRKYYRNLMSNISLRIPVIMYRNPSILLEDVLIDPFDSVIDVLQKIIEISYDSYKSIYRDTQKFSINFYSSSITATERINQYTFMNVNYARLLEFGYTNGDFYVSIKRDTEYTKEITFDLIVIDKFIGSSVRKHLMQKVPVDKVIPFLSK
jgi:hypothetical protein